MTPLRRAGRGGLLHGDLVIWSVAEGAGGRRWRWMTYIHQAFLGISGLIELAPDGRFSRLELATSGGLLTFHPDQSGRSAHGNIVTANAVLPIATSWQPDWGVGIVEDPFGSAIGGWRGDGLVVTWHRDELVWREPGHHTDVFALPRDDRGVPQLANPAEWPLEVE